MQTLLSLIQENTEINSYEYFHRFCSQWRFDLQREQDANEYPDKRGNRAHPN
ncbi:hypothetical protein S40288_10319 [Stachybotrys chartarum IBT 40288]|nr:hypothetical protein S40288_10319 [Stachybotrys chartarum IBT 40288]